MPKSWTQFVLVVVASAVIWTVTEHLVTKHLLQADKND